MTTRTNPDNYIELQDLWKTSYPALSFTPTVTTSISATSTPQENSFSFRRTTRPANFGPDITVAKSPTLPFYPTSPLPSIKSPFLPPRPSTSRYHFPKPRAFKSTKQKTSAAFQRITNNLNLHIHSGPHLNLLRKMMNASAQRAEKKEEAKRLAKEEFHRNWDAMTEEEQAEYIEKREEAKVRERKRLEDIKNGTEESRRADAKTAAISGAIVVCM